MAVYGGIEAGGTKFLCMVAGGPQDIRAETRFPTTEPDATLARAIGFFHAWRQAARQPLAALGIGSFGPLDLNPASPTYGHITSTPKPGWAHVDIAGKLRAALQIPVTLDTDVNAAAVAEYRWGASQGLDSSIYFTIGTGIGAGVIIDGQPMHGLLHPEMGHIRIPHDRQADPFPGVCPFHGDCFEGLASGNALRLRWGQPAEQLPPGHPAWELEAGYIALALVNQVCSLSPKRIILGGGVMQQADLLPLVRQKTLRLLNNYVQSPTITAGIETYIVSPLLGNRSGVLGAIALAQSILDC